MLRRLIIILLIFIPALYFSDMDSTSRLLAYVLPIISFICFLAFCIWIIDFVGHLGVKKSAK